MPVFWLAVVGAVALLIRRTWKASKRRRQRDEPAAAESPEHDNETPEPERPALEADEAIDVLESSATSSSTRGV